jgi:hypothetical protein
LYAPARVETDRLCVQIHPFSFPKEKVCINPKRKGDENAQRKMIGLVFQKKNYGTENHTGGIFFF